MSFEKFNTDADVTAFARQHSPLFSDQDRLQVEEIGDGNINFVYRVFSDSNSLIVKQALPYIRVIGEGWPLSQDRIRIECEALKLAAKNCQSVVPEVYGFAAEQCAIVMQDIGAYGSLRSALIERQKLPLVAEGIGCFLADTLFYTSDLYLGSIEKKALVQQFINPDLCKISEEVFFWDPYCDHERNNVNGLLRSDAEQLWQDVVLKREVARLKAKFLNQAEALLHADLHSGSVFANQSGIKVIDPEFAFVGPIGFDIGLIIANYLLNLSGQANLPGEQTERSDYQQWLLASIETIWDTFDQRFRDHIQQETQEPSLKLPEYIDWYMQELLADSLGYAGTEMIRRTIGVAHVDDVESISDPKKRADSERLSLVLGQILIKDRAGFRNIDQLVVRVRELMYCR
ncbi:S-methyl-5-thioribose kinase [Amphritea japonica]|uniref:S-methyl-5-thioribose kinase n=1 Tax=Amphritea japonica ATCC BAA-1530 TaxID=1278309 RepID=A0A7R6P1S9_9GAMM|nr:S-methyl-5-thioribose kinase [Amphritea japonica]BBB25593.1 5-methylthioribose kinase [Amphritea japonica ATCC BAA-1530]